MDVLLNEKGLMARLGQQVQQARDTVSEQASSLVINAMAFLDVLRRKGSRRHVVADTTDRYRTRVHRVAGRIA